MEALNKINLQDIDMQSIKYDINTIYFAKFKQGRELTTFELMQLNAQIDQLSDTILLTVLEA